jgi:hypothetical protein
LDAAEYTGKSYDHVARLSRRLKVTEYAIDAMERAMNNRQIGFVKNVK